MPTPLHLKPATARWIVTERKRLGLKPSDVVVRLAAMGLTVSEPTVKVWESNGNRLPAPENLEGLERIFGSQAPGKEPTESPDLARAIKDLVGELRQWRTEDRVEIAALRRAVVALGGSILPAPEDAESPAQPAPQRKAE